MKLITVPGSIELVNNNVLCGHGNCSQDIKPVLPKSEIDAEANQSTKLDDEIEPKTEG